jgi:hypothetical protein
MNMTSIARQLLSLILVSALTTVSGCQSPLFRGQSPDIEPLVEEDESLPLVGDLTTPSGMHPIALHGVGLVARLADTGSDPPPSVERDVLLDEMHTHDTANSQQVLASKKTSLVIVRGYLPPGVQKGDRFDIEVVCPANSETTSLQGGWLFQSRMREMAVLNNSVHRGDIDGLAGGDVLVDAVFGDHEDPQALRRGRVLGGGVSMTTRKLGLVLRDDEASVRASSMIGNSINNRFFHYDRGQRQGVAKPINSNFIELAVPPRYRNNVGRYMLVVRSLAVGESAADRVLRLKQLEARLLEPTTASSAALQLEAIGKDAQSVLRIGLQSRDPEVRFYAAEALAYLDDQDAAAALGQAAASERAFRWHALTALSTMDHVSAYDVLSELLNHPSAETRYGAFRAMQVRNPRDPVVRGEILGDSFAFHQVGSSAEPLVHFAHARRPELVLFGHNQLVTPPKFLLAGRRLMIKRHDDQQLKIIRFEPGMEDQVVTCPNNLAALIHAMVDLGARYEDVYEAVRAAKAGGYLESRLAVNARARTGRVYRRETELAEPESSRFAVSNPLPELFQDRLEDRREPTGDDDFSESSGEPLDDERGWFDRMKGWFAPASAAE